MLNKLGHTHKNTIDNIKYMVFHDKITQFLRVSQNIDKLHNFCQICVLLFRPGSTASLLCCKINLKTLIYQPELSLELQLDCIYI